MARLLVSLLVLATATLSACQWHEEAPYINHVSHGDLVDFQRKVALHDDLMNGLQSQATRGAFKEMKVDSKHKEHVKEMLRGEIKPLREGGDSKKHEANVLRKQIEASILADVDRIAKEHANLDCNYPKPTRSTKPLYMEYMSSAKMRPVVQYYLRKHKDDIEDRSTVYCERYLASHNEQTWRIKPAG